jgi:ABC-type spermidine/putrescine transport system permease subunit II
MSETAALTPAQKTRIWIEVNLLGRLSPAVTLLAYLFLFVPIVVLIAYSFNASRSTVVWSGFTFDWYGEVFQDRGLRQALQVSVIIAFVSALASTAIGALTALAIVRRRFPGRDALSTLLLAPMVLPEIVMAVALLVFMVALNITLGYFSMIVSHVLITLDRRLEEAAADLGADEWQIFWRVTFPLLLPPLVTAFLLAATLSFDNFVMSTFTSGVGTTPLPLRIYSMLKLGITPKINALGALMVLLNVLVVVMVMGRHLKLILKKS